MSKILDESDHKDLLKRLEELGLREKEAAVYVALLPLRDTGTSNLIRATGLHGQFVYDALERLEALGLARHVVQNGRKKFNATAPSRLLSLVEEKKLAAQSIAKELQARFSGQHEQDFEVFQGESAFIAHQMDLLKRTPIGGTLDVIVGQTERYLATFDAYGMTDEFEKLRVERKISGRYLGAEAQRDRFESMKKHRPLIDYRIVPKQSVGLISIDIWTQNVTTIFYGEPMLCFTLSSKEVADGYRDFFNAVWDLAGK